VILALLIFLFYKIIERRKLDLPKVIEYAYLIEPDGLGSRHVISSTAVRIGRSQGNDICLQNNSISLHHAEIHRRRDGTFYIVDLGSTNGVMVNQEQVTQVEIKDGDVIELGEVRLNFYTN
jgi:pSer/pThr/pTyr-binding forkhead associated (FHA) protein